MPSVVLNSYNPTNGCLSWTITGSPAPGAVLTQSSLDNGVTWDNLNYGNIIPPRCGYFSDVPILWRVRLEPSQDVSNTIFFSGTGLIRTPISTGKDISFCNSPIHIRLENTAKDVNIASATLYLYIWSGAMSQILTIPNATLYADKVSASDKYINFEISELIKSYLINPNNAPNTNQPNFSYNELDNPAITGQGVFWQVVADVKNTNGTVERKTFRTSFATLGYLYNEEQTFTFDFTASQEYRNRFYNPKIHNYFKQTFDFTKSISNATTGNIILFEEITPAVEWRREALDPYLIVFINKLGLWETFTPHGKVTINEKVERTERKLSYRDPSRLDNSYNHSKITDNIDVTQSLTINTGSLFEEMVEVVAQIVYSPKIYLIKFKGDVQTATTVGITIDNNLVSIDSLLTTIDGLSVEDEYISFFKTHKQIPVILTDSDFEYKTRLNDKNKIDYNLKFEVTTNKINDIR